MADLGGPSSTLNSPDDRNLISSDISELFKCHICLNIYVQPKLLKCGHTFCYKCIKEVARFAHEEHEGVYSNPQFSCPECRENFPISSVRNLLTNYRVIHLIEFCKSMKTNKSKIEKYSMCNNCEKKVEKDELFHCRSCPAINGENNYYCGRCSVILHNGHALVLVEIRPTASERLETTSQILSQIRLVTQNYEQNIRGSAVEHAKSELLITIKDSIEFLAIASEIELIPTNSKITKDDLKKCHDAYNKLINSYKEIIENISTLDNNYIERLEELKQTYRNVFTSQIAPYYPNHPLPMIFNPAASSTSINDNPFSFNSDAQQTEETERISELTRNGINENSSNSRTNDSLWSFRNNSTNQDFDEDL